MPYRVTPRPAAPPPAFIVARAVLGGRRTQYLTATWQDCPFGGERRPTWANEQALAHVYRTERGAVAAAARWGGEVRPVYGHKEIAA